jgi:hypothetical protein
VTVDIPLGAHHLDLMFAHPHDPPCVRAARDVERREIQRWIQEAYDARPPPRDGDDDDDGGGGGRPVAELALAGALGACASAAVAAAVLMCQRPRRGGGGGDSRRVSDDGGAAAAVAAAWRAGGGGGGGGPDSDAGSDVHAAAPEPHHAAWDAHTALLARGGAGYADEEEEA